jgi:hypothetical protein
MKLAILFFAIIIFIACNENSRTTKVGKSDSLPKNDTVKNEVATKKNSYPELDFFQSIPDTIEGCSELFTYDTTKMDRNAYIFASNLTSFAIIRIKGKYIYLNKNRQASRNLSDSSYIEVFEGNGYKAVLTVAKITGYDEGGFYKGTLEIAKGEMRNVLKVHGTSGC